MKNIFSYHYNLEPDNIIKRANYFVFSVEFDDYYFMPYFRDSDELKVIHEMSEELIQKNIMVHKLIPTKEKKLVVNYNDENYILLKSFLAEDRNVTITDIMKFSNQTLSLKTHTLIDRTTWNKMWESKNDYLEYQISELGINYPVMVNSFSYYIGLAENAISYYNDNVKGTTRLCINHRKLVTLFDLYNPLEFIIDNSMRNISEYIKYLFFYRKEDLWDSIEEIFIKYQFSSNEINLFYSRLLYPTYYFNLYDEIIVNKKREEEIVVVTSKQEEYEDFLADIYFYLKNKYDIVKIDWIIKKTM